MSDALDSRSEDAWSDTSVALFDGDEGGLSFEQRRCLVTLLKSRYISRRTHQQQWDTLIAHRPVLTARLNDLFLELHVDTASEVAFKRQAVPDGDRTFPTLLHNQSYSREETILLVALRERLHRERAGGAEIVTVDHEDLLEAVEAVRAHDEHDIAGEHQKVATAVATLVKMKILEPRGDGRYVVAPVLDALLPLERLRELLDWLQRDGTGDPIAEAEEDVDEAEEVET